MKSIKPLVCLTQFSPYGDTFMQLNVIIMLLILALSAGCSTTNSKLQDLDLAVQHDALIQHYEDAANEMQLKVDEHKKILQQYEKNSYLYGRHTEDFNAHCQELIDIYENAVTANLKMSDMLK